MNTEHPQSCYCERCTHERCLQVVVDVTPSQAARTISSWEYRTAELAAERGQPSDLWALIRFIFDEALPQDQDYEHRCITIHIGGEGAAFVWLDLVLKRQWSPAISQLVTCLWRPTGHRLQGFIWVRRRFPLIRTRVREDPTQTC